MVIEASELAMRRHARKRRLDLITERSEKGGERTVIHLVCQEGDAIVGLELGRDSRGNPFSPR